MASQHQVNPYIPPQTLSGVGTYGDGARRLKGGFLYRQIEFTKPFQGIFLYNGWNFLQRIFINDTLVWRRVSWIVIHRSAKFRLPSEIDSGEAVGDVEIRFGPGLWIRRFTVRINGIVVYDE